MSFAKNVFSIAVLGLFIATSAGAAFAQVGGSDVPTDAKKQGTKENGSSSTGMSKSDANGGSMKKDGGAAMEKKSGDKM